MKKLLFILGLAGVMLTSCDPQKAEGEFVSIDKTVEGLMEGATFAQFALEDGKYVPSPTGNYIQYEFPSVQTVTVFWKKGDERKVLAYGKPGGMVYYMPARGSDPVQTLYFAYLNGDGTEVIAEKQFTLEVAQALDPATILLASERGSKKWKWCPTAQNSGAVWGNGGYAAGPQDGSLKIEGAWWGCGVLDGDCEGTFEGQTQHAGDRWPAIEGECYALSYMEFNEEGGLIAYSPEGVMINDGTFAVKGFNNNEIVNETTFSRGTLTTSAGAILWPFQINTGGGQPTEFEIGWLDSSRMILICPPESGNPWDEATWWSFMSDDDPAILATHDWYWKPTKVNDGAVWGNGGYLAGSQNGNGGIEGAWWGCGVNDGTCPDTFEGQMQHAGDAYVAGEEYSTSKMSFNMDDAIITVYDKDGNQIRQGSFSLDLTPDPATFSVGTLETSAGAILWPFQINTNGGQPTKFEVGYFSSDTMILICPPESGNAWDEATWWSFGKK